MKKDGHLNLSRQERRIMDVLFRRGSLRDSCLVARRAQPGPRWIVFVALAAATGLLIAPRVDAQSQILHASGDRPSFEVATIKPWRRPASPPPTPDGVTAPVKVMKVSPGDAGPPPTTDRLHMILPISILITSAYNLPAGSERRIIGGPDWLRQDIDQFEIQAKIEGSEYAAMQKMTPAQQHERVALMEQSLLADRFKLKVHFETREMPVYALEAAKSGAKLNPAKNEESSRISTLGNQQGNEMTAVGVTLEQFVLSPLLTGSAGGRPVVNQTGLKGAFDFALKWTPDQLTASAAAKELGADAPSFFTAIREQLGLLLVPSKAPVEVIVIDHIEPPSAN
jgi:bla regulator protein BlaR1